MSAGGKESRKQAEIRAKFASLRKDEISGLNFLPESATDDERTRYDLCQDICRIFNERKMSLQALALAVGLPVNKANQVVHSHYHAFSTVELSTYLERLLNSF